MRSFTKRFDHLGSVELAGEVDLEWDDHGNEVIADEIRVTSRTGEDYVLRREVPGVIGVLFTGLENALLEQFWHDEDVSGLYSAAARREGGYGHRARERV